MNKLWLAAIMVVTVSCFSCETIERQFKGEEEVSPGIEEIKVDSGVMEAILLTRVDQLRMRKYPNIKSNILTTLDDNMPVRFTGEETDFEESIGRSSGNWKRVKSLDDRFEGWIYSGEGFVEWMITPTQRDSISRLGKGVMVFGNMTKPEFSSYSGSSLSGEPVGTRYSGWYTFDLDKGPQPINDTMKVISRQLDSEKKQVNYMRCNLAVRNGMPESELNCYNDRTE